MANQELIVDEENLEEIKEYITRRSETMNEMISQYLNLLRIMRMNAIYYGEVAKSLDAYINYAKQMEEQLAFLGTVFSTTISSFVRDVDDADTYLF